MESIKHIFYPQYKQIFKERIEGYFKESKFYRDIDLTGLNINAEQLRIIFNTIKDIKYYYLYLNYNLDIQFKDSDDEVIQIICDHLKDTQSDRGTICLPREFKENAAKKILPYFKESKINSICFERCYSLSDEIVEQYNKIGKRLYAYDHYFDSWSKKGKYN